MNIKKKTVKFVSLAVLTAIIVLLQVFAGAIAIGATSFSLVLVPIVLGALLFGPGAGAFLGAVFGLITVLMGVFGMDVFTSTLINQAPLLIVLICMVKGTAAGLFSGLLFRPVSKKNRWAGVICATAAAPITNTGLFILGALPLKQVLLNVGYIASGSELMTFLIIGCAGINFLVEFGVNLLLTPAIYKIVNVIDHKLQIFSE